MRWRTGPIRKRHVPEPERLRQLAATPNGQADKLLRKADALIAEAEALEGARQQKRKDPSISTWRRRIGAVSTVLGFLLFAVGCFVYLRYASNPSNLHVQERLQHTRALGLLWTVTFHGSLLVFVVSPFGLGWSRWSGLVANGGAFLFALMTLGALCGPFGCS